MPRMIERIKEMARFDGATETAVLDASGNIVAVFGLVPRGESLMRTAEAMYCGLTKEELEKARLWRSEHFAHVQKLVAGAYSAYPPTGSDAIRPELWTASHWKWFGRATRSRW